MHNIHFVFFFTCIYLKIHDHASHDREIRVGPHVTEIGIYVDLVKYLNWGMRMRMYVILQCTRSAISIINHTLPSTIRE